MIKVIYDSWGQMGNRLWEYIDQVAWAKATKNKVLALFWDPSLEDFDNLRNNPYIKFPLYIGFNQMSICCRLYQSLLYRTLHNIFVQNILSSVLIKNVEFVSGKDIIYKNQYYPSIWGDIKSLFSPKKEITEKYDNIFADLRNDKATPIVGVHIRRGDYKQFCNGQFYYTDDEYIGFMKQICGLFGENTRFFISTNENINLERFNNFDIVKIPTNKPAEDMYCLSKCDYIIGPYSSFSAWASFYGNVPYCCVMRNQIIVFSDFDVVNSFSPSSVFMNKN